MTTESTRLCPNCNTIKNMDQFVPGSFLGNAGKYCHECRHTTTTKEKKEKAIDAKTRYQIKRQKELDSGIRTICSQCKRAHLTSKIVDGKCNLCIFQKKEVDSLFKKDKVISVHAEVQNLKKIQQEKTLEQRELESNQLSSAVEEFLKNKLRD